jgi:hypothetical protein
MLRKSHRTRSIGAFAATLLVVALVAGCGGGDSSSPAGAQATDAKDDGGLRTVLVFDREPKAPSPSATDLHAGLEKGRLRDGTVEATVLTDEDCAPDRHGVSHCRNVVQLVGGRTLVLRHPHEMHRVPCLEPGETVLLRRQAGRTS